MHASVKSKPFVLSRPAPQCLLQFRTPVPGHVCRSQYPSENTCIVWDRHKIWLREEWEETEVVTEGRISDGRRDDKGRMLTKGRTWKDRRFTKGIMRKDRRVAYCSVFNNSSLPPVEMTWARGLWELLMVRLVCLWWFGLTCTWSRHWVYDAQKTYENSIYLRWSHRLLLMVPQSLDHKVLVGLEVCIQPRQACLWW
jgi:hypothetical protein